MPSLTTSRTCIQRRQIAFNLLSRVTLFCCICATPPHHPHMPHLSDPHKSGMTRGLDTGTLHAVCCRCSRDVGRASEPHPPCCPPEGGAPEGGSHGRPQSSEYGGVPHGVGTQWANEAGATSPAKVERREPTEGNTPRQAQEPMSPDAPRTLQRSQLAQQHSRTGTRPTSETTWREEGTASGSTRGMPGSATTVTQPRTVQNDGALRRTAA